MSKQRKKAHRKTARVYYGYAKDGTPLYWRVRVRNATRPVIVKNSLADAMAGTPGTTIGCHLSRCAQHNPKAFDHPVLLAAFSQTAAIILTDIVNGAPSAGIKYGHRVGRFVTLNDKDPKKLYLREHPEIAEVDFTLYPPKKLKKEFGAKPRYKDNAREGDKSFVVPRGALKRAIDARLILPGLESAITDEPPAA